MGKIIGFAVIICNLFVGLCFRSPVLAFNDDSKLDLFFSDQTREVCENGKRVTGDSKRSRFSCKFEEAFVDSRGYLFKNNKRVSNKEIIDFKLSRNGKLFYRLKYNSQLYGENGLLQSGTSNVLVYLVSSNGKVVYLNKGEEIFKDGKPLNSGLSKVPLIKKRRRVLSPAISSLGTAFYITEDKNLFKNGRKINPHSTHVQTFKLDHKDNVFYMDMSGRLYKNGKRIYGGPDRVLQVELGPKGQLAYLTDSKRNNLNFNSQNYSAGVNKIVDFWFDRQGDLVYRDGDGRRWKNGRQTGR